MSVYEVRPGKWKINITLGGRRINRIAGRTKKEAIEVEAALRTKFRLKQLKLEDLIQETKKSPTFMTIASEYLHHIEATKSHRTWEMDLTDYNKHILPVFGDTLVDAEHLTNDDIRKFQAAQKSAGYANRTVNIHISLIRKIINYGITYGHVDKQLSLKYPMLGEPKKELAYLEFDEWERLNQSIHIRIVLARIQFGRFTGLRPGELAYLAWEDISWPMKTVRVRSKPGVWEIKTKHERTVPLNDDAVQLLREVQEYKKRKKLKGQWIFSNSTKPVLRINKSLSSAGKKAGIKKRVTPNMIRHTFATHALASGADLMSIKEIMGHTNLSTTERYLHAMQDRLRGAVDVLNAPHPTPTLLNPKETSSEQKRKDCFKE